MREWFRPINLLQPLFCWLLMLPLAGYAASWPVLDLSDTQRWKNTRVLHLDTAWAFHWQQWLREPAPPETFLEVPGLWHETGRFPVYGYGTYGLQLRVPASLDHLYLAMPDAPSAWRLYADGKLMASNGRPATSRAEEEPEFGPRLVVVPVSSGQVKLALQVSNFHYKEAGVWHPIRVADSRSLHELWLLPHLWDLTAVVALAVTGLYMLLVFGVRRRATAAFWLGLFCLLLAARAGLVGQRILYDPEWMGWTLLQRLEHALLYLSLPAFAGFFQALFPGRAERRIAWVAIAGTIPLLLSTLLLPVRYFADWAPAFQVFSLVLYAAVGWRLFFAFRQRRPGAGLFAFSYLAMLAVMVHDLLLTHFVIDSRPLLPLGVAAFILFQVLLLNRRYARSLAQVERLRDELAERNRRLEEADAHKDEFLAMTSHEMRTPLHAIAGLAEDMRRALPELPADRAHQLDLIAGTAGRLSGLVNDILDFSAIREGHLKLDTRPLSLSKLAASVIRTIEPSVAGRDLVLSLDIAEGAEWVKADPDRLQQILVNLLANSAKSTSEGFIWLKAEPAGEDRVAVSVVDTGEGFPEAVRDALFSRSSDWRLPTEDRFRNGGLGLMITRRLVRLHGDDLEIDSRPGMGTEIRFHLPAAPAGSGDAAPPIREDHYPASITADTVASPCPPLGQARHVAVVDDDEANRLLLRRQLEHRGYRVSLFPGGPALLGMPDREMPDLVLLDVMMPDMSGFEVLSALRAQYDAAALPVIMVTARHQVEDIVRALDAGANDYLTKPFSNQELLARVSSQLGVRDAWLTREENRLLKEEMERRQQLQASLRRANRRMLQVLEQAADGVILLAEDLNLLYLNERARQLTGLPLTFGLDMGAHLPDAIRSRLQGLAREPAGEQCEFSWTAPGGELLIRAQAFLENERVLLSLLVAPCTETVDPDVLDRLTREVRDNRSRMAALESMLQDLSGELMRTASSSLPADTEESSQDQIRRGLVDLMRTSLHYWERYLGKSKVELAEESRCWRVYLDGGTAKTRTLDKYLTLATLPKRPRWRLVIRTANFVMAQEALPEAEKADLERRISEVEAALDSN